MWQDEQARFAVEEDKQGREGRTISAAAAAAATAGAVQRDAGIGAEGCSSSACLFFSLWSGNGSGLDESRWPTRSGSTATASDQRSDLPS